MSNVKSLVIEGELPYDFMNSLSDREAAYMGQLLLNPAIGIRLYWYEHRLVPNTRGGQDTLYRYQIAGSEAMSAVAITMVRDILRKVGTVEYIEVYDIEAHELVTLGP